MTARRALLAATLLAVACTGSEAPRRFGALAQRTDVVSSLACGTGVSCSASAGAVTVGNVTVASWGTAGSTRWYCIDGTNGSDANVGYSDTSSAQCGTRAKATLAGLGAVFPRFGAGRKVVVVIARGTYTGGLDLVFSGVTGYANNFPLVVATATDTTGGATAFLGDAADRNFAGGTTATGMFAAGYNPTGSLSASTLQVTKVGGGAPGWSVEPAFPLLARARFDAATATVALRNQSRMVRQVTASDTFVPLSAFSATPTTSDVVYIEMPGVTVDAFNISLAAQGSQVAAQIVGIRTASGTVAVTGAGTYIFSFCDFATMSSRFGDVVPRPTYVDEGGTTRTLGLGIRMSVGLAAANLFNAQLVQPAFGVIGSAAMNNATFFSLGNGASFWSGLVLTGAIGPVANELNQPVGLIGSRGHVGEPVMRVTGTQTLNGRTAGVNVRWSSFSFGYIQITGMGANPAIVLNGTCAISVTDQLLGSTGNTDVCLDLVSSVASLITMYSQPTCTGTAGDVRLANGTITSWAALAAAGITTDAKGNRIVY